MPRPTQMMPATINLAELLDEIAARDAVIEDLAKTVMILSARNKQLTNSQPREVQINERRH